ncbi:RNA polymerase sigma factor [Silicimonas algicola]|uniref:RNA polymerase sigma-70 factor (ECF subfamily) n=1 Tax=Silicimonas algicola TaxID=1826607 RepID=A0A316G5V2_9RHOB|nr:RNA polymerase sigma factor [Silicimonas algicola]AZQ68692.1 RNA polymerase sigma factor [Silicimonas algicola]PWK56238.1 RNA polymerase sigma-70 factor (ECF subfamily) [Silicimonas algicola]
MTNSFERDLIAALPALRRYALSLCRKSDIADDLVQTCVERALAARVRYDPGERLDPWLFRILRNAWLDMTRRMVTRGTEIDVTETPEAAIQDGARVTEAVLFLHETERAMAALPDDQREVLHLVCFEELSYAETAEVLGIPKGTVMSRLARARIALAERLGIN